MNADGLQTVEEQGLIIANTVEPDVLNYRASRLRYPFLVTEVINTSQSGCLSLTMLMAVESLSASTTAFAPV